MADETAIQIRKVTKVYGSGADAVRALHDISVDIRHNEFFTLLGPSGCGKTTLLRIIGGFEDFQNGEIILYGNSIKALPANKRPVNTVFQHYALFPHMSIRDNIGFGLKMLGKSATAIRERTDEMLDLVKLKEYGHRRPAQLSGGQQQRVALARALAPAPKVVLLDEPLSALDLKLRQSMRHELRHIRESLGMTFVFVTHDQEEALTMSDRIAVMSEGELQQVGSPEEIYNTPANIFVADFIGQTNLIPGTVESISRDAAQCRLAGGQSIEIPLAGQPALDREDAVRLSIRPEHIDICRPDSDSAQITGILKEQVFLGTDVQILIEIDGSIPLMARLQSTQGSLHRWSPGDRVGIGINIGFVRLLTG